MIDSVIEEIKTVRDQMETENKDQEARIKKQMKAERKDLREEMKEDRKSLQDSIREIKMSFKRSKLETQRMNRELLDRFDSKTNKCNQLLSQVPKKTEVEMTTENQMIEKNVELINTGVTGAAAERQELLSEVVNVASVR
jgi:hypothetical protein